MSLNECEIIQEVLSGDREAYVELINAHQHRVFRYCLTLLANASDAEAAAHDVFVAAYESLAKFEGRSSFLTWICRIAHNHCLGLLRKRSSQKTDSINELMDSGKEPVLLESASGWSDVRKEECRLVQEALVQIRPAHREILVYREVEGLSYEEIAMKLDCSLDAVRARLRRARLDLQDKARHFLSGYASIQCGGSGR
ncbi:MAG: RNA polymerase sigma factor [Elusimicrobiota bacterium]|jgi:RNA polymerase sigma-70 factor (ECF subfamily)